MHDKVLERKETQVKRFWEKRHKPIDINKVQIDEVRFCPSRMVVIFSKKNGWRGLPEIINFSSADADKVKELLKQLIIKKSIYVRF